MNCVALILTPTFIHLLIEWWQCDGGWLERVHHGSDFVTRPAAALVGHATPVTCHATWQRWVIASLLSEAVKLARQCSKSAICTWEIWQQSLSENLTTPSKTYENRSYDRLTETVGTSVLLLRVTLLTEDLSKQRRLQVDCGPRERHSIPTQPLTARPRCVTRLLPHLHTKQHGSFVQHSHTATYIIHWIWHR